MLLVMTMGAALTKKATLLGLSSTLGCGITLGQPGSLKDIVTTLIANEQAASEYKGSYEYVSKERSDRTGGRLWTEKVVETRLGKVRMLVEEDGVPLSAERVAKERGRLP